MSLATLLLWSMLLKQRKPSVKDCKSTMAGFVLDCTNRGLEGIPYDVFDEQVPLIKLGNNPYNCDCSMVWFMREPKKKKEDIRDLTSLRCARPKKLLNRKIIDLTEKDVCQTALVSRSRCSNARITNRLICDNLNLKHIPFDLFKTRRKYIYLKGHYVCNCNMVWFIRRLKERKFNKRIMNEDKIRCATPKKLYNRMVSRLTEQQVCPQKEADLCNTTPRPCNETTSTCQNRKGSYRCVDIDECLKKTFKCQKGEECVNQRNGYRCNCKQGLVKAKNGIGCVEPTNPCIEKPKPCNERTQKCVQGETIGSYTCEDLDECALNKHDCHKYAGCINSSPGFSCRCKPGFIEYSNGRNCKDANECSGNVKCGLNATCVNTIGSYFCACKFGYHGNGRDCKDIDECAGNTPCAVHAKCENTAGSYKCACNDGYRGNGKICLDINECLKNVCPSNARCVNRDGSYRCLCKSGYSFNGEHCLDIDECTTKTHTCDRNALCINNAGGYRCRCNPGFEHFKEGRLCLKDEESSSNANLIVILVVVITLLIFTVLVIFLVKRRKHKKKAELSLSNKDQTEQTLLLLKQQNTAQQPLFLFNDGFADIPPKDMTGILASASIMTEWSEEEEDYNDDNGSNSIR